MLTQYGELEGIKWLSEYKGGRTFLLHVGQLEKFYECDYEPIFGVDAADYARMNELMDEMQKSILYIDTTSNENIEKKIKRIEANKKEATANVLKSMEEAKKKREIEKQEYYANKPDDSISSFMYQFSAGYIDFKEMVSGIADSINPTSGKNLKVNFPPDYDFNNPKGESK